MTAPTTHGRAADIPPSSRSAVTSTGGTEVTPGPHRAAGNTITEPAPFMPATWGSVASGTGGGGPRQRPAAAGPCPRRHDSPRTSDGRCRACNTERQRGHRNRLNPSEDVPAWPFTGAQACLGTDPEAFFTDTVNPLVRRTCAACPVRDACLEWALVAVRHGVWAGTTEQQRAAIRRERRRDRAA